MADKAEFETELIEGHKGVTAVIVPFNPEEGWSRKPVRLAERRHGWLVSGTVNRVRFDGYIGERWGRFFITIGPELREAARVAVGDVLNVVVQPTNSKKVYERALEQSKATTQPAKARPDAIVIKASTIPKTR
jgi:hypothetical protein